MSSVAIHTHSGRVFDVLDPDPDLIRIEDIAHALAYQCRFNGHVNFHYSVGQHSLLVAEIIEERFGPGPMALTALMHDATECFLPDVVSPLKPLLQGFREMEQGLGRIIAEKYGLLWPEPFEVKQADLAVLAAERDQVISPTDRTAWRSLPPPALIRILPRPPEEVEREFLRRFERLAGLLRCKG